MIEIIGTALTQWDTGRVVQVTGVEADHVHFANHGDSKAVIMGIADSQAKIPDYLLQTGKQLCVYAVKNGITLESKTFYVKHRERPENYVYEDDRRNYIYELITSAETAVENANLAVEGANLAAAGANAAKSSANLAAENANKSADSANLATKNANEAADKAAHTAKSLMVVGKVDGANIYLDDAIDQFLVGMRIFGKTTQAGTPTPDAPVELVSVGDYGSVAVDVVGDYKGQRIVVATPNGLPGIPVRSGGNYTDTNGQQWICDEVDLERGVLVKRIKKLQLNGTESWKVYKATETWGGHTALRMKCADMVSVTSAQVVAGKYAALSNFYSWGGYISRLLETGLGISEEKYVYFRHSGIETLNEWTAFLAEKNERGTPVELHYVLETPIETPLSEEDLAAYASLRTYRGNTTVFNDASAHMEIEYVMDARKYIDGMISTTIIAATVE